MACAYIYLVLLSAVLMAAAEPNATHLDKRTVSFPAASQPRQARLLGNLLSVLLNGLSYDYVDGICPPNGCPPWRCQQDSAVIHGYCCGCARPSDNVPFVTCRPDLRCPLSSEPLCTDYNFMMDCCCTGP